MDSKEEDITKHGRINTRGQKHFTLKLTEAEMQAVCNGITGFYNTMNRDKARGTQISPQQTSLILNVMDKFKEACNQGLVTLSDT